MLVNAQRDLLIFGIFSNHIVYCCVMITTPNPVYRQLLSQLQLFDKISDEDLDTIMQGFSLMSIKKGELLVKQGSLVNRLYFINSGFLRAYYINEEGEQFTTSIGESGQMMTSFEGFQKGVKATEFIEALSDCELLVVNKSDYDRIYRSLKSWPKYCTSIYENAILRAGERLLDMQRLNATQRYEKLLRNRPNVAMHVPVKYLASYLGLQPQSLSRIRAQIK